MTGKAFLGQRRFVEIFFPSLNTVTETYRNKKKRDSASPKTCQHNKLQKKSL